MSCYSPRSSDSKKPQLAVSQQVRGYQGRINFDAGSILMRDQNVELSGVEPLTS